MGLFEVLLSFISAPYYGSLQQYTLSPIQGLAAEKDLSQFKEKLYSWQAAKAHELKVVQVAVSPTIIFIDFHDAANGTSERTHSSSNSLHLLVARCPANLLACSWSVVLEPLAGRMGFPDCIATSLRPRHRQRRRYRGRNGPREEEDCTAVAKGLCEGRTLCSAILLAVRIYAHELFLDDVPGRLADPRLSAHCAFDTARDLDSRYQSKWKLRF